VCAEDGAAEVCAVGLGCDVGRGELDEELLAPGVGRRGVAQPEGRVGAVGGAAISDVGQEKAREGPAREEEAEVDTVRDGEGEERGGGELVRRGNEVSGLLVGCGGTTESR
jgi:hypothetical protein